MCVCVCRGINREGKADAREEGKPDGWVENMVGTSKNFFNLKKKEAEKSSLYAVVLFVSFYDNMYKTTFTDEIKNSGKIKNIDKIK